MKSFAATVALLLGGLAVALCGLEIGVRLWAGVPVFSIVNFVGVELDQIHKPGNPGNDHDPVVGWVQKPGLRVGTAFTSGEFGARMPSAQIVRLQQGAILTVGDSFAVGSGVADKDTWPAQVERALGTQVINAAVGGYGFDQSVLRAELLAAALKPRTLLVQTRAEFGISLSRMNIAVGAPKPYFVAQDGTLSLRNTPVPHLATAKEIGRLRAILGYSYLVQFAMTRLDQLQWWVAAGMMTQFATSTDEALEVSCLLMKRLADLRDRAGLRVVLVSQYAAVDMMTPALPWQSQHDRFFGCARDNALEVVDTLDDLRKMYDPAHLDRYKALWQMSGNGTVYGHMSAEGNALVAAAVARHLRRETLAEKPR